MPEGKGGRGGGQGRGRGSGGKGGKPRTRSSSAERKNEDKATTKGNKGGGKNNQGKVAPAKPITAEREKELQRRLSKPRWCAGYLVGTCQKSPCTLPHLDQEAVDACKLARAAELKERKAAAAATRATSAEPQQ